MDNSSGNNAIQKNDKLDDKNNLIQSGFNLINNIESFIIVKKLISLLENKTKLEIIKYNKKMQAKFELIIDDYKKESGRYIKGERNGKGKEYKLVNNQIVFEGEYLNGKRNGKGKEFYYTDKLKFEGEYLNGKRNGKGKEFYYTDKLKFQGEYLNGKKMEK